MPGETAAKLRRSIGGLAADSRIRCSTAAANGLSYARLTYGTSA